jgi:hypothetical protein
VDGYFANLITVRTFRGVDRFQDFVLLPGFQSNVTLGNWNRSLRQVKSGMATTECGPIARVIINFWAAYIVSTKFIRGFKSSVSTRFLGEQVTCVHKISTGFQVSVSTEFSGVSRQACPKRFSGFIVKCVHRVSRGFKSSVSTKFLRGFKSSVSTKFLRDFKSNVSTKFLRGFKSVCPKCSSGFLVKCDPKFLGVSSKVYPHGFFGVSSQVCPQGFSGFQINAVLKQIKLDTFFLLWLVDIQLLDKMGVVPKLQRKNPLS